MISVAEWDRECAHRQSPVEGRVTGDYVHISRCD